MKYGMVTLEQSVIDGSWRTNIVPPDDIDREDSGTNKPVFAWFFHFPETMSGEDALNMLIDHNLKIREKEIYKLRRDIEEIKKHRIKP